jgi:hypothetical protein
MCPPEMNPQIAPISQIFPASGSASTGGIGGKTFGDRFLIKTKI